MTNELSRRSILKLFGASSLSLFLGCKGGQTKGRKLLILGFDGMDFNLVSSMMDSGKLPGFLKVARKGCFLPLISSTPPQSPVAWSNFITGKNPGGHGIFDFIARDPKTYLPSFSLAKVSEPAILTVFGKSIPLGSQKAELLRKGDAWWKILEENDVPSIILNVPSNFPPVDTKQKSISGMGTPDILGTYGTFSFYTTEAVEDKSVQGGNLFWVEVIGDTIEAEITGPNDPDVRNLPSNLKVPFNIFIDPSYNQAKFSLQENEIILKEGEWSDWVRVSFSSGMKKVFGIIRLYLKSIRPEFNLYISPVNIDPQDPAVTISTPSGYSAAMADKIGPFYTQGIPEDTWALNEGRLNEDEFLVQAGIVRNEREAFFKAELANFNRLRAGVFFCYFGTTDTGSHMFWGHKDPEHPVYDPQYSPKYATAIEGFYRNMDEVVQFALSEADKHTEIIIMSDHGFAPFYKSFHLNRWLLENGYLALVDEGRNSSGELFENVDWSRTKVYALGLNSVYLNLEGREGAGIVNIKEASLLLDEVAARLNGAVDPDNGKSVISGVYRSDEIYNGEYTHSAPDLVVGYSSGYRASWETALGKVPEIILQENKKKWSGDHCIDPAFVPGIFLCTSKINRDSLNIEDIAPTILKYFGVATPPDMDGKSAL